MSSSGPLSYPSRNLSSTIQDLSQRLMSPWLTRSKILILLSLLCTPLLLYLPSVHALDTPVTATIPDFSITTPILISPPDNSTVDSRRPTLTWQVSTSPFTVVDYDLYLDGVLAAEGILHSSGFLDSYFFTATRSGEFISITPSYDLSGGYHQWYVVASNEVGNTATSVEWEFLVDTIPPQIILKGLDFQVLNWDTANPTSIPDIDNRNLIASSDTPTIYASTEAFTNIKIDLVCPVNVPIFCANLTSSFIISTSDWSYQVPHLFSGVTYTVFISATDSGANTTLFPSFTITLSPSQIITTPTDITPPQPASVPPTPPRNVPKPSQNVVSEIFDVVAPPALTRTIEDLQKPAELATNLAVPVATISFLAQLIAILSQLWYYLLHGFITLMQYFGFWQKRTKLGFVYDAITKQPLFMATVRLYKNEDKPKLIESDVTNKVGIFSFSTNPGSYLVQVIKNGYRFPSNLVKGGNDGIYEHVYHGEVVKIDDNNQVLDLAIPADPENATVAWRFKLAQYLRQLFRTSLYVSLGVGFISAIIAIIAGANIYINTILIIIYTSISFSQAVIGKLQSTWGIVIDKSNKAIPNISVHLIEKQFQRLVAIRNTDANGRFQFIVPEGSYIIKISTPGFEFATGNKRFYSGETITVRGTKPSIIAPKIMVVTTAE